MLYLAGCGEKESRNTRSLQFRPEKASPGIAPQSCEALFFFKVGITKGRHQTKRQRVVINCRQPLKQHNTLSPVISFLFIVMVSRQWTPAERVSLTIWGLPPPTPIPVSAKGGSPLPLCALTSLCAYFFPFPLPPLVSCFSQ